MYLQQLKRFTIIVIIVTRDCGYYGSMVDCQSTEQKAMGSEPGQTHTHTKGLNYCIYSNKRRVLDKHPPHPPPSPTQTQISNWQILFIFFK